MKSGTLLNLGRQTIIYGLSGAAIQVVGLVTLPVFARVFSPAEYGVIEIANVTFAFILVMADAGFASASQRSYFDYDEDDAHKRRGVLLTALLSSMLFATVLAALLFVLRDPIADFLFAGQRYSSLIVLVAVAVPLSVLVNLSREAMRLRFRAWHYVISSAITAVVAAGVGLLCVLVLHVGVESLLIGILAGNLAATVYGLLVVRGDFAGRFSRHELRVMLAYGLPLVPTAIAAWALAFLDRLMLAQFSDLDEVGQYAIATRLGSVVLFAVIAFATAFAPFILSLYAEDREQERQMRAKAYLAAITAFLSLSVVVALFAREGAAIIAPGFEHAHESVGLVCLGLTAFGASGLALTGISLARQTHWLALYTLIAVVVNVVLNALLIPPLGQVGAAAATLVAFLTLTTLYHRKSQQLTPAPVPVGRLLRAGVLAAAVMVLGALTIEPLALALAVKLLGLVVFFGGLRVVGVITTAELGQLRELVAARLAAARSTPPPPASSV